MEDNVAGRMDLDPGDFPMAATAMADLKTLSAQWQISNDTRAQKSGRNQHGPSSASGLEFSRGLTRSGPARPSAKSRPTGPDDLPAQSGRQ